MPMPWTISTPFSGVKFAARYSLTNNDFYMVGNQLFLREGVTIPDDPPIVDPPDAPVVVLRNLAVAEIDSGEFRAKLLRGVAAVLVDEFNLHALKINAILDAVDGAATLAALKTAIAAIPDYPQRTLPQVVTAIKAKINAGTVD